MRGSVRSQSGATALILASEQGNRFTVKVLLDGGANKSARNKVGAEYTSITVGVGPFAWRFGGQGWGDRSRGRALGGEGRTGDGQGWGTGLGGQGWGRPGWGRQGCAAQGWGGWVCVGGLGRGRRAIRLGCV